MSTSLNINIQTHINQNTACHNLWRSSC